jgi:ABC-type branched-subunit amino acid transport system substrate-binding protein
MRLIRSFFLGTTVLTLATISGCTNIVGVSSNPVLGENKCEGTTYVRIASDFSGAATDIGIPHFWGIYDYLRNLNAAGGIRGCSIDIDVKDNSYTPAKTIDIVNGWRTTDPHWKDVSALFIFGTGPTTAVGPQIMTEKKVVIPGSYAGSLASPAATRKDVRYDAMNADFNTATLDDSKDSPGWPYIFFPATDYGTAIRLGVQAAWTIQPGRMSFAHDTADKCAYCVDPLAAGKSFLPSLQGMSIGRDLIIPQTSAASDAPKIHAAVDAFFNDATTGELAHFTSANTAAAWNYEPVSWVWSGNSVYASAILAKEIVAVQQRIDTDPAVQAILAGNKRNWKIRVIANNWGIGETTTTICGVDCNKDVIYGLFPVPRYAEPNSSGMGQLTALHDHYANLDTTAPPPAPITPRKLEDYRDVRYVQGYAAAAMWAKAMNLAIDRGSKNPTGEELKSALESFNGQDVDGLTAGPITFTGGDHRPQSSASIYRVDQNGSLSFVNKFAIGLVPDWLGY